jgi:hypothetical protein
MIVDNFEEMRELSEGESLVMGISLHAHCAGQPFRLRHFRRALEHIRAAGDAVWSTTAGAIATHYATLFPPGPTAAAPAPDRATA